MMGAMTIRQLSDETHRAIKARANANHRSAESEVRAILDDAVSGGDRPKLGSVLKSIGAQYGGVEPPPRRPAAREPIDFS